MNEAIDLEQLERQAFLSFHQDGLLDLCLGAVLLQLGIIIFLFPSSFGGPKAQSTERMVISNG
jgi:hypothetical protein